MRVVLISKALLVGSYQRKAEEIARQGVELTVLIPPRWVDRRGVQEAERMHTCGYDLRVIPAIGYGSYHLHFYPTLRRELDRLQPHVVHMDEEPYNLATWLGIRAAQRVKAATTFFTWQNIARRYPLPFRWMEQANYRACPVAIAGNRDAAHVLRCKGYQHEIQVIPQFGVDPAIFTPVGTAPEACTQPVSHRPFHIGYAGGLIPEKGVDLLVRACTGLQGEWSLSIAGSGAEAALLQGLTRQLGLADKVHFRDKIASDAMPGFYRSLDVLVLPSRTQPNWKEQFGRVLIEAMACGVPVVGSDSGEIPHVIGDGGLVFPEENVEALCSRLQRLMDEPEKRWQLGQKGRNHVLHSYTMRHIAEQTVAVYQMLHDKHT